MERTPSGSKAYQRKDNEDRGRAYRDWHRRLAHTLLATDVDSVEWRYIGNELRAVAVIETTRVDSGRVVDEGYLRNIIERFDNRSIQGDAARAVAAALGVPAYLVLFRQDCSEFWLYKLSRPAAERKPWEWRHLSAQQMETFITRLGRTAPQQEEKTA